MSVRACECVYVHVCCVCVCVVFVCMIREQYNFHNPIDSAEVVLQK